MPAARAFSIVGTIALVSLGVIRMPLAPGGDQVLDRRHLGLVVAVELAGEGAQLDAELLAPSPRRLRAS